MLIKTVNNGGGGIQIQEMYNNIAKWMKVHIRNNSSHFILLYRHIMQVSIAQNWKYCTDTVHNYELKMFVELQNHNPGSAFN